MDIGRKGSVDATVRGLLLLARQARVSRDIDALGTISDLILESFNGSSFAEVARFHKAHCLQAHGNVAAGRKLLTEVIKRVGSRFRARGLLALGASYRDAGEYSECRSLYLEAIRAADESDPLTRLQSLRMVAVVQAIEGDHFGSLSALQSLVPQTLYLGRWYPADVYDLLNSIAIELGELGRVDEAARIIDRVLRTPFAKNCPHWLDTKIELAKKRPLIFPPFTIAIGAPAAPPQRESEALTDSQKRAPESQPTVAAEPRADSARSADRN
ncbi:MAG: tetratricopeptide repeat protein, partial [Blastocatellia bacterium]